MTENNTEWIDPLPLLDNFSGGTVSGVTLDGEGWVFATKHGEFICHRCEDGIVASFPEGGLVCSYGEDGDVTMVTIILEPYLSNLIDVGMLDRMPNKGADIELLLEELGKRRTIATLTANMEDCKVEMMTSSETGEVLSHSEQNFNLDSGSEGSFSLETLDVVLPFKVVVDDNQVMIGMGESLGDQSMFGMLKVRNKIDFQDSFVSGNSLDVRSLADKIILN
jgi:hypothetical protein